jgi:endonuclease/exonuclease/phosphatase (EEP) superfamily protein YafD
VKAILRFFAAVLRALAFILALAAAGAAVLAMGGVRSDQLDILTLFAPLYIAGAVLALAIHLITPPPRLRATLLLALIALVGAAGLMTPDILAALREAPAAPGRQTVKLVQYNVWGRNQDPDASTRWILSEDPDVVVLEEAFDKTMAVPKALKRRYPYRTTCAEPNVCSTMILSKVKPAAEGGLQSPGETAHLSGAWATFGKGPRSYTIFGVHYTWPLPAGPQQDQSRRLAAALDRFDRKSVILAGDFNSTPWSFSLRRQDRRFGLIRRTHLLFSWPSSQFSRRRLKSPLPFLAIDHVYAGTTWRTVSVRRGPKLGSDHYPVVAVLTR